MSYLIPVNIDEGVCLDFSGSSQYVDLGDSSDFTFGNGSTDSPFSMMMWVNMDDATNFFLFNKDDFGGAGNQREYRWFVNGSDKISIVLIDNSAGSYIGRNYNTTLTSYQGQWIHVAFTYSGNSSASGLKIYINGIRVDDTNESSGTYTAMENKSTVLQIGARAASGTYANGRIDDARIFASELTAEQIWQVYSTGENPSTPLGHWEFNDGSGITVTDSGSGGNNGDLTGHAPTWTTSHNPFYARRARATSTDLLDTLGSTAVNSISYTIGAKPGGTEIRLGFSEDGSTFANSNGDTVDNTGGYSFDGVDDYVGLGASNLYTPSSTAMTITAWVNTTKINYQRVISLLRASGSTAFGLSMAMSTVAADDGDGKPLVFYRDNANALQRVKSTVAINDGTWHHLIGVLDNTNIYLYVDGVLAASNTNANAANTKAFSADDASIGNGITAGTWFRGSVDDVRIYGVALSVSEIWNLYAKNQDDHTDASERKLWLKLDGDATDSSGNGNDGTVNGATALTEFSSLPALGEVLGDVDVLSFDGVNDTILCGGAGAFDAYANGTVSTWFKLASTGVLHGLLGYAVNVTHRFYIGISTGNQIIVYLYNGSTILYISASPVTLVANRWYHVAYTSSGSGNILYIDGVAVTPTYTNGNASTANTLLGNLTGNSCQFDIGRSLGGAGTYFYCNGTLANTAIHSSVLSASQIYTDFENGYPIETNLVAFWHINDGTGTNADDPIGSYDGTIYGATWTKDSFRPEPNTTPPQREIDLTALSYTSAAYYRALWRAYNHDRAASIAEISVDYTAGGGTEEYTATGGAVGGGEAEITYTVVAAGGAVGGGDGIIEINYTTTGGAVGGGEAEITYTVVATGGAVGGGEAEITYTVTTTGGGVGGGESEITYTVVAAGGAVGGGDGIIETNYIITATGGAVGGGVAILEITYTITATGGAVGGGESIPESYYVSRVKSVGSGTSIYNAYRGVVTRQFSIGQLVAVRETGERFLVTSIQDNGTVIYYVGGKRIYVEDELIDSRAFNNLQRSSLQDRINAANRRLDMLTAVIPSADPTPSSLDIRTAGQTVYYLKDNKITKNQIKSFKATSHSTSYKLANGDIIDGDQILGLQEVRSYINNQIEALS